MPQLQFWKLWPDAHQRLFWIFASLTVFGLGFLWFSEFNAPSPVIEALRAPEIDAAEFTQRTFRIGTFTLGVPAEALLILERTVGGPLTPNFTAGFIFLGVLVTALLGMLTVITTLPRFWFFTGLGFFAMILIGLRMETVLLFGWANYVPVAGAIVIYTGLACYFGLVNSRVPFLLRFVLFAVVTVAAGMLILFFAKAENPFAQLAANAMPVGTLITLIFIFTIAHEIIAALIGIITRGTRQTHSLRHFLIISSVYLINLGLIYANRKFLIHWEFLSINLMVFLTLSGILGLWGFRQREPQYTTIFAANPTGVLIYLCLAAIGFTTIGYFFATANDPVIRLAEDAVLYGHLGYGIIFMIYVINNFGSMLYKNLQAYRHLYTPEHMPYFTFRLAGLICTFVFFAYSSWRSSVNQVYSGYYNAWGDVYLAHDTLNLSASYFDQSARLTIRNYHAHYALAQLSAAHQDPEREEKEYNLLANSRPLDLAYLNLSALTEARQAPAEAMNLLRAGLRDFPKNGRLQNELGLDFAALGQADSALYYVTAATHSPTIRGVAETNRIALAAKFFPAASIDSLLAASDKDNSGVKSNALALACIQGTPLALPPVINDDTTISIFQILSLHNYLMSHSEAIDSSLAATAASAAHKNNNPYYRNFLLTGAAFARYSGGQTGLAIKLLREAAFAGQVDHLFNVLGLWCLEQNVPANATRYFDEAIKQEFEPAIYNRAIALTEAGDRSSATAAWQSVLTTKDSSHHAQAREMLAVLTNPTAAALGDAGKYQFTRYRIALHETNEFERVVNTIADSEWKVKAVASRSFRLEEAGESDLAGATLEAIAGIAVKDPLVYQDILHQQLLQAARSKNWTALENQLRNKNLVFTGKYRTQKIYIDALRNAQAGKKAEATRQFKWLLHADPFFEDAVLAAIDYLTIGQPSQLPYYSALVAALDFNPDNVKLLQRYAVMSLQLDFPEAGETTMERLKAAMSPGAFLLFLKEYPELFQVGVN